MYPNEYDHNILCGELLCQQQQLKEQLDDKKGFQDENNVFWKKNSDDHG